MSMKNPLTPAGIEPATFQEVETRTNSEQMTHKDGTVVSLTHRPLLHLGDIPGTHFC